MSVSNIEDAIADIRKGKAIILVDDEDRENEGDFMVAAEKVTPDIINFMALHGRGLICLTLTEDRCEELDLPQMVARNTAKYGTAFTVSIEAKKGVTTGISAADRALTILTAIDPESGPDDIDRPLRSALLLMDSSRAMDSIKSSPQALKNKSRIADRKRLAVFLLMGFLRWV